MKKTNSRTSKTKKQRASKRKTQKKLSGVSMECKDKIVRIFIEMINAVKIYHWKTRSHSQHKATDELYGKMNDHVDKFIETMLGKDESRIKLLSKHTELYDFSNTFSFKERIYEYREFLLSMSNCLKDSRDSDLLNIRDEILGDVNQFLYLLTFNK